MAQQEINVLTSRLIKTIGKEVGAIDTFAEKMVCIEGVISGLIVMASVQHNRQPDELVEAVCEGIRRRVTQAIYGGKQ